MNIHEKEKLQNTVTQTMLQYLRDEFLTAKEIKEIFEASLCDAGMTLCEGSQSQAAVLLSMSRGTLRKLLNKRICSAMRF